VLDVFRQVEIDLVDLEQRKVTLVVLGRPDLAADGVAGAQVETPNLTSSPFLAWDLRMLKMMSWRRMRAE